MTFFNAVVVVITPLLPALVPGLFFSKSASRIILWSMSSSTVFTTLGLIFHIPVHLTFLFFIVVGLVNLLLLTRSFFTRHTAWQLLSAVLLILIPTFAFTIPFLNIHDGLPTGDIQKTIIFANEINGTSSLPVYDRSIEMLNRDPVDFYTPGLHAVSAFVMGLSPFPLTSISIFSICIAVGVAIIAGSITKELFDSHDHRVPPILTVFFVLTQFRFLRYLREPGYHFQNVVGELFLFGMIWLIIRFVRKQEKQDAALFLLCGIALFLSHQFSTFIVVFMMLAMAITALGVYRKTIISSISIHKNLALSLFIVSVVLVTFLFSVGLGNKIPSIFTTTPHLTSQLPAFMEYPTLMGEFWFFSGFAGLILMLIEARRRGVHHRQVLLFGSAVIAIFLLSQGPAIGIDIPPVRALFYLAIPLSIGAAYVFGKLFFVIERIYHGKVKQIARLAVVASLLLAGYSSTYKAYTSLSHTIRTNSTLTGEQLGLIDILRGETSAVLIDDYSRRSASWLVLSGAPMYTRIAADLERQMMESNQSTLRRKLYLNQIDYEKIIELGSLPEIASLLQKHHIGYVTGVAKASQSSFDRNSQLQAVGFADDLTLYKVSNAPSKCVSIECIFLLKPSTLANDIGDEMDTYEHLQVSVRSPLLSNPLSDGNITYREATSPLIPFSFNVGDYVQVLWDPNNVHRPETTLTFMLWLKNPVQGLYLRTSSGAEIPLPYQKHITVELPQNLVQINEKGFVLFTLVNSGGAIVPIDLIALGTALIP